MVPAAQAGKLVVRLHTGDPSVYGAHREQIDLLRSYNLDYKVVTLALSVFVPALKVRVYSAECKPIL